MIGDFYKSFKRKDDARQIPESVLEVLRMDIPKGYDYQYNPVLKRVVAAPIDKNKPQTLQINADFESLEGLPEWARESPESLLEYLYRTQTRLPLKSVYVKDDKGELFSFSKLHKDPFSEDKDEDEEVFLFPSPFPKGTKYLFETDSGAKVSITIRRQPYDSRDYIKLGNEDFPALSLVALYPEHKGETGKLSVSVTPKKAGSVEDAIVSLEILQGYIHGTLSINGHTIGKVLTDEPDYDEKALSTQLDYWRNLRLLEECLNVKFNPQEDLSEEDYQLYNELVVMFINKNDVRYTKTSCILEVTPEAMKNAAFKNEIMTGGKTFAFSYVNGPNPATILGASFDLHICCVLVGVKVDRVESDDDGSRITLVSSNDQCFSLYKRYALDEETIEAEQRRMQSIYMAPPKKD